MIDGYQTRDSSIVYGSDSLAVDLSSRVSGWDLPGSSNNVSRLNLGAATPTIRAAGIGYALSIPALEWDDDTRQALASPSGIVILAREDDERGFAAVGSWAGSPLSAPEDGTLVSSVGFTPSEEPFRGNVQPLTSSSQSLTVPNDSTVFVAVTAGNGRVTRGGTNVTFSSPGVRRIGGTGTTVAIPATATAGWLFAGVGVTTA